MSLKKTMTLPEAAEYLGVNERKLREIRAADPIIMPEAPAGATGKPGRPSKSIYSSDVRNAKRILTESGVLTTARRTPATSTK